MITTIEDTGIGIPDNMLERIFDRFSQVDGSKSRAQEGTGIGLALAREIVLVHKGTIRAESELGKGSRFIVELLKGEGHFDEGVLDRRTEDVPIGLKRRTTDTEEPRVQDIVTDYRRLQLVDLEKVDIEGSRVDEAKVHDALILCVDDNPEVLKLMKMLLADEFDLELVTSAEQGLAFLRAKNPDLVLCDVMMPGMDGHAFSRAAKSDESTKHIPIILVTARTGAEMLAEGMKAGADDYISKPFDSTELKARIRSQLRLRQMETELTLVNKNLRMRTSDLVEQQRSLFLSTVKSLASAIDAKDEYTRHHSTRVTDFSMKIAAKMGFSEKEIGDLELAALLHDVGKIAVPESILNKPGQADERGVRGDQGASRPRREHPQPGHRAQGDRPGRPGPPRALRRNGLPRPAERPGDPPGGADHGHRRHLRLHHLGAALPQGRLPPLCRQGDHRLLGDPVRPGSGRALPRDRGHLRPGSGQRPEPRPEP